MSCRYCTCADCSFTDTGAVRYPIGGSHEEDSITIPRDQYELYREAAEAWAEDQTPERKGGRAKCLACERTMYFNGANGMRPEVNHTADCDAAIILGLEREGVG